MLPFFMSRILLGSQIQSVETASEVGGTQIWVQVYIYTQG